MTGLFVVAWSCLPIEDGLHLDSCTYATVIVFEVIEDLGGIRKHGARRYDREEIELFHRFRCILIELLQPSEIFRIKTCG